MKIVPILIAAFIFTVQLSYAQLQVGPKAGLSTYQLISGGNNGLKTGIYTGGFLDYELNNKFNLQLDVAYLQKGSKDKERTTSLNYIGVAPSVKIFTKIKDNTGLYITTGFGFNFFTSGKVSADNEERIYYLDVNTFDFSLQLGIGYKLKSNLSIDFKFLDGSLTTASSEISNLRNVGANLTLAYGFDL